MTCQKVDIGGDQWIPITDFLNKIKIPISHDYCSEKCEKTGKPQKS